MSSNATLRILATSTLVIAGVLLTAGGSSAHHMNERVGPKPKTVPVWGDYRQPTKGAPSSPLDGVGKKGVPRDAGEQARRTKKKLPFGLRLAIGGIIQ